MIKMEGTPTTFDYTKTYILENDRVQLRPLVSTDSKELSRIANAPEIWTYFLEDGLGEANFKKYIASASKEYNQGKSYPFVVFDKVRNEVAGMTRLYDFIPELQSIKMGHTWYGLDFQGTGVNKNCKFLLFDFLFGKLNMERVGFGVHGENLRSIAALKSVGCSQEGVLRNFLNRTNGEGRVDLIHLSILREEWETDLRRKLADKLK